MSDKYKSFAITVRPRNGISDETIEELIKWITKKDYGIVVIEMEDEARHLHAQIWLDEEVTVPQYKEYAKEQSKIGTHAKIKL